MYTTVVSEFVLQPENQDISGFSNKKTKMEKNFFRIDSQLFIYSQGTAELLIVIFFGSLKLFYTHRLEL